jgi:hypothetical protein
MRLVTLTLGALLGTALAAPAMAQEPSFAPPADFGRARAQFVEGKYRPAANTLRFVSVEVRRQLGRSQHEALGMQLLAAEERLERLAASMASGQAGAVSTLDATFAATDRLLAEHHASLASVAWDRRARSRMDTLAIDLGTAASYYERAFRWEHRAPAPEATSAIAAARELATRIASDPRLPPKETGTVIATLLRTITTASPVIVAETGR